MEPWSKEGLLKVHRRQSWWWMALRRLILPLAGCRDRNFCWSRSRNHGGSGTVGYFAIKSPLWGFSEYGVIIGQRGAPGSRRPKDAVPLGAPWGRLDGGWPPSGAPSGSRALLSCIFLYDFSGIFRALFFDIFLQCMENSRQKLALGTELIG